MESKEDMPKIHYLTALDVYMITCFVFVLSAIVEFAFVHYHSKTVFEQDLLLLYRLISLNKRLLAKSSMRAPATASSFRMRRRTSSQRHRRRRRATLMSQPSGETIDDENNNYDEDDAASLIEFERLESSLAPKPRTACINWQLVFKSLRAFIYKQIH